MYSQYGEDDIIAKLVPRIDPRMSSIPGKLLDIGAWDPIKFSNSRLLIEQGWEAVLIEFSPLPVRALLSEYGSNPKVRVIQAAMSLNGNGTLEEFAITDDAVSTNDPQQQQTWAKAGGYFGKLWVPKLTWDHFFLQFGGGYEFINIDTEGSSVDLAKQLLQLGHEPKVICVEHDGRIVELMSVAQTKGYALVHSNGTNAILHKP